MLKTVNRLAVYARSKHITINTAKSELVHFNPKHGTKVPIFKSAGAALKCSDGVFTTNSIWKIKGFY